MLCITCNMIPIVDVHVTGYLVLKIRVSWDCTTNSLILSKYYARI